MQAWPLDHCSPRPRMCGGSSGCRFCAHCKPNATLSEIWGKWKGQRRLPTSQHVCNYPRESANQPQTSHEVRCATHVGWLPALPPTFSNAAARGPMAGPYQRTKSAQKCTNVPVSAALVANATLPRCHPRTVPSIGSVRSCRRWVALCGFDLSLSLYHANKVLRSLSTVIVQRASALTAPTRNASSSMIVQKTVQQKCLNTPRCKV